MNVEALKHHVESQIKSFLCVELDLNIYIDHAVERMKYVISHVKNKYISHDYEFSVFNSVQYCIFLYELSRICYKVDGCGENAEKIYYLNKIMHSIDIFYEVNLPYIWYAEHPIGTILGRASYGDYFFVYQGCTVGGNKGEYPTIGNHVTMFSNSKVLGTSNIGDNVVIGANAYVKDTDVPSNSLVFGQYPNLIIKKKESIEVTAMMTSWSK